MDYLKNDRALTFEDCVQWARMLFEKQYNNAIQQLLYNFPKDATTSSRHAILVRPQASSDPAQVRPQYTDSLTPSSLAATNLHAFNYNINDW